MSELKACPFCGVTGEYELDPIIEIGAYGDSRVRCQCCDSSTNYVGSQEDYSAEMLWNRRPLEDALNKRIAELEAERDKLRAALERIASSPDSFASLDMFMKKIPINCKLKKIAPEALKGGE